MRKQNPTTKKHDLEANKNGKRNIFILPRPAGMLHRPQIVQTLSHIVWTEKWSPEEVLNKVQTVFFQPSVALQSAGIFH